MSKLNLHKIAAIAGLMGSVTILGACTETEDLTLINSCYQAVSVGEHFPVYDSWSSLEDGEKLTLPTGRNGSILLSVLPADAEQIPDPIELQLDELEWDKGFIGGWTAELDLNLVGRCPTD